jgi:hypothetical protein
MLVWIWRIGGLEQDLVLTLGVADLKVVDIVSKAVIVILMAVFVAKSYSAYPYLRVCDRIVTLFPPKQGHTLQFRPYN